MLLNTLSYLPLRERHIDTAQLRETAYSLPYIQLCGAMKSGTSLLEALLDGTPDTLIYPHESELMGRYYFDMQGERWLPLLQSLHRWYLPSYLQRAKKGALIPLARVLARQRLVARHCDDLWTRHASFALAFDGGAHSTWIDKSTLAFYHWRAVANRPHMRIVHIVRHPADVFSSIYVKMRKRNYARHIIYARLWRDMVFTAKAFDAAIFGATHLPDSCMVVRYEDLVSEPEHVMRRVCDFTGLQFTPNHLKPTTGGLPWGGNNHEGRQFNSVSRHGIGVWRSRMPAEFAMVLEHGREARLTALGYAPTFAASQTEAAFSDFQRAIAKITLTDLYGGYGAWCFGDA